LLQLQGIAKPQDGKNGRIVPSTTVVVDGKHNNDNDNEEVWIGEDKKCRGIIGWPALK